MRLFAACLMAAGIFAQGAQAQQQCDRTLSIGAWNIEWLGNAKKGNRPPQAAKDVASYIAVSNVDVLALEEISKTHSTQSGAPRNKQLDDAFEILNAGGAKWRYELFPKNERARDPDDQWTGLAWNANSAVKLGHTHRLAIKVDAKREDALRKKLPGIKPDESVVFSRWPHVVIVSAGEGKTDIAVVVVHMKSNSGGEEVTAEVRAYEAELLLAALTAFSVKSKEMDFVVLGDTNMLRATEAAGKVFDKAGYRDCNRGDKDTYHKGSSAPFDRIFVQPSQPETRDTCSTGAVGAGPRDFGIMMPGQWIPNLKQTEFRERLSDHVMVKARICVQKDDD